MRQKEMNGISFSYAESIGFAFLPCIIKANGTGIAALAVIIKAGAVSKTYRVDSFGNNAIMDYREYIQALFDGRTDPVVDYSADTGASNHGQKVTITASAYNGDGEAAASFDFSVYYVWGAIRRKETWNGYKRLTWFTHYPFSFGLYNEGETKLIIGHNKTPWHLLTLSEDGIINIGGKVLPTESDVEFSMIYTYEGDIKQATFDEHFDLTFHLQGGKQAELMLIEYNDADEGEYLRWVDRHGFLRYWLFVKGEDARTVSSDSEFIRDNLSEYPSGRRQNYQREDAISLCAPLVDAETFDFLQDVTSSPVVERYLGGDDWEAVTIKAGTFTKSVSILQDFTCEMIFNNTNIQSL